MKVSTRSMREVLERHLKRWQDLDDIGATRKNPALKVIALSRQPGSRGKFVATRVAQKLDLPMYDRDLIQKVADAAQIDSRMVHHRDEKGHSVWEIWSDILASNRQLWAANTMRRLSLKPDQYMKHLRDVMEDIADKEGGLIVGRGANHILPPSDCLRVRIIAPMEMRVENMARIHNVSTNVARNRILRRQAHRREYVQHYFGADVQDPENYDLVVNMGCFTIEDAAHGVINAWNVLREGDGVLN